MGTPTRRILIVTIILIGILSNICWAQVLNIRSLDGKNSQIHVLTDDEHGALVISCLQDTIRINDLINIKDITI